MVGWKAATTGHQSATVRQGAITLNAPVASSLFCLLARSLFVLLTLLLLFIDAPVWLELFDASVFENFYIFLPTSRSFVFK